MPGTATWTTWCPTRTPTRVARPGRPRWRTSRPCVDATTGSRPSPGGPTSAAPTAATTGPAPAAPPTTSTADSTPPPTSSAIPFTDARPHDPTPQLLRVHTFDRDPCAWVVWGVDITSPPGLPSAERPDSAVTPPPTRPLRRATPL